MRFDGPDLWVVLKLVSTSADTHSFELRDDRGSVGSFALQRGTGAAGPAPIDQTLLQSIELAAQDGKTLPLFLETRLDPLTLFEVADLLASSFPALAERARWQLVPSSAPPATFTPFELPLNILTLGPAADLLLSRFRQHSFVDEASAAGGLSMVNLPLVILRDIRMREWLRNVDIVIADDFEAERILKNARPVADTRLLIVVAGQTNWIAEAKLAGEESAAKTWKQGTAVISLPAPFGTPDVVDTILMAIVHDQPLHQWLADLLQGRSGYQQPQWLAELLQGRSGPDLPLLIADRVTDHALRMSDAFAQEARRQLEAEIGSKTEDSAAGAKMLLDDQLEWAMPSGGSAPPSRSQSAAARRRGRDVRSIVGLLGGLIGSIQEVVGNMRHRKILDSPPSYLNTPPLSPEPPSPRPLSLPFNFDRESNGLLPLSRARVAPAEVASASEQAVPGPLDDIADQRRRVDARIERVERVPGSDRYAAASEALWVGKDRTLRRGARYKLRVQIGRSFPGNLISDDTPDLLLPPSPEDFWTLDIVVFAKDFTLASEPLLTVRLPKTGASPAVYFDLVTPATGDAAELRFGIYLGNQLLQSFLLTAVLDEDEFVFTDALRVALDIAKSGSFGNLDTLRPRAFSIGVNDDATPGKHTLLMKIDGLVQDIPLEPAVIAKPLARLREILQAAAVDGDQPVFPEGNVALTPDQRAIFEETIRKLARVGSELYAGLFTLPIDALNRRLREIMASPGEPLQFPRFSPSLALPWPLFYDFAMPEKKSPAVCTGTTKGKPCGHKVGADVVCINGFWGIRHVIEEILRSTAHDSPSTVQRPAAGPLVCTADGDGDGFCKTLVDKLVETLRDKTVIEVDPTQDVLDDVLWKSRPAVMMFLGHLEEATEDEPRRIKLPGEPYWLTSAQITKWSMMKQRWAQPNALVLLMACTAMQMNETTLHDHALAFSEAGAAAVIGPECMIFPAFACRFAQEMILAMLVRHMSVGAALTEFRRETVRAGNPLGFAFTVFGDADVTIV